MPQYTAEFKIIQWNVHCAEISFLFAAHAEHFSRQVQKFQWIFDISDFVIWFDSDNRIISHRRSIWTLPSLIKMWIYTKRLLEITINHLCASYYVPWLETNICVLRVSVWLRKLKVKVPRNLKRGVWSLFYPCANDMGRWLYSRMEVSYCTFEFGAIIWRDLGTLSLLGDSPHDNLYACVI